MNYKQIYAIKRNNENKIKQVCGYIADKPGIYIFHRTDENGIRHAYCGQAVNMLERCASHLSEYDHIALSLKKRGFYGDDNPYGWKLDCKPCQKSELDEKEVSTIKLLADQGYQLLNHTGGSQGKGKTQLKDYKPPKTYQQGIEQGKKNCSKDISNLFEKHLNVTTKSNPPTVNQQKALEKFNDFLSYWKGETNDSNN